MEKGNVGKAKRAARVLKQQVNKHPEMQVQNV